MADDGNTRKATTKIIKTTARVNNTLDALLKDNEADEGSPAKTTTIDMVGTSCGEEQTNNNNSIKIEQKSDTTKKNVVIDNDNARMVAPFASNDSNDNKEMKKKKKKKPNAVKNKNKNKKKKSKATTNDTSVTTTSASAVSTTISSEPQQTLDLGMGISIPLNPESNIDPKLVKREMLREKFRQAKEMKSGMRQRGDPEERVKKLMSGATPEQLRMAATFFKGSPECLSKLQQFASDMGTDIPSE